MINLDPSARPSFDTLLHTSRGTVFPESFYSFLHNYVSSINDLPTNAPFSTSASPSAPSVSTPTTIAPSTSGSTLRPPSSLGVNSIGTPAADSVSDALPNDSDHRMDRIWADYESVEPYLTTENVDETVMDVKVEYASSSGRSKPFQVSHLYSRHVHYSLRADVGYTASGASYTKPGFETSRWVQWGQAGCIGRFVLLLEIKSSTNDVLRWPSSYYPGPCNGQYTQLYTA